MKTAVEWLVDQLDGENHLTENEFKRIIKQAKEMEKEQIIDAREALFHGTPEQYYNETFKSE